MRLDIFKREKKYIFVKFYQTLFYTHFCLQHKLFSHNNFFSHCNSISQPQFQTSPKLGQISTHIQRTYESISFQGGEGICSIWHIQGEEKRKKKSQFTLIWDVAIDRNICLSIFFLMFLHGYLQKTEELNLQRCGILHMRKAETLFTIQFFNHTIPPAPIRPLENQPFPVQVN